MCLERERRNNKMPPEIECKVAADKAIELVEAILVSAKKVLDDKKEFERKRKG